MDQVRGSQSIVFSQAPYIISAASVAGSKEAEGPLAKLFDMVNQDDLFGRRRKAICRRRRARWHLERRM